MLPRENKQTKTKTENNFPSIQNRDLFRSKNNGQGSFHIVYALRFILKSYPHFMVSFQTTFFFPVALTGLLLSTFKTEESEKPS